MRRSEWAGLCFGLDSTFPSHSSHCTERPRFKILPFLDHIINIRPASSWPSLLSLLVHKLLCCTSNWKIAVNLECNKRAFFLVYTVRPLNSFLFACCNQMSPNSINVFCMESRVDALDCLIKEPYWRSFIFATSTRGCWDTSVSGRRPASAGGT